MTVGIISYLSQRGLGTMAADIRRQLGITRQLVVPDAGWPYHEPWMNGEEFYLQQWEVQRDDLVAWQQSDGIKTLISIETGFSDQTFKWAKELGMRTALIVMWEHFNPNMPAYRDVDLYICPSFKAYQEVPFDNKVFMPYPIDVEEFPFRLRSGPAKVFVHNAGSGGMGGRKGTRETIDGFVKANVQGTMLLIRAQESGSWDSLMSDQIRPYDNIKVDLSPKPNRSELYTDGSVLIYPSHYDGHALVTLEGMASGMPVITTDAEPMNEYWAPGYKLAVKVGEQGKAGTVNPHCMVNRVDIDDLAAKIRWCAENDMGVISRENRNIVEKSHNWATHRDRWKRQLRMPS